MLLRSKACSIANNFTNSGKSWTSAESDKATIIWGGKELTNPDTKVTGYVKSAVNSDKIDKNLASVTITKQAQELCRVVYSGNIMRI